MQSEKVIITLFAKDCPGIVQALSDTVLQHSGNWLESSLSRLCGQFTGIVHIEVAPDNKKALLDSLAALTDQGIQVTVQSQEGTEAEEGNINALQILVEANDRPGIVGEIASALAAQKVNVDHMDTEVASASMAGYQLFRAHLFLALPENLSEAELEASLEKVSDDVMVSVIED